MKSTALRMNPSSKDADYAVFTWSGQFQWQQHCRLYSRVALRIWIPRQKILQDFSHLTRYPDSKYAPDARDRIQHLRNSLAAAEVNGQLLHDTRRVAGCV